MAKLKLLSENCGYYAFMCPGCGSDHGYYTKPHQNHAGRPGPVWEWNGSLEKPTFTPSLLINAPWPERRCHLHLTEGQIHYCPDCHHQLAGQTVECPEWED
ncbi:MAG: DUF6527 family protein [Armatimonadia bacterium]